jgi:aspartate aminotransferase
MLLKEDGFKVDAIAPQAAIYLTVQFDLRGQTSEDGKVLHSTKDVTQYLLNEAKLAIVPFSAFGASENSSWYRISMGTCRLQEIEQIFLQIRQALGKLYQS